MAAVSLAAVKSGIAAVIGEPAKRTNLQLFQESSACCVGLDVSKLLGGAERRGASDTPVAKAIYRWRCPGSRAREEDDGYRNG